MVRVKISTADVGCRKPRCKRRLLIPQRHHRKYETLFITSLSKAGVRTKKLGELVKRYHEFHSDDTVALCPWHHAEIHVLYREIVRQDCFSRMKRISNYSWKQIESLMKKLEKACREWEQEESPGVDPLTVWPDTKGDPVEQDV